MVDVFGIVSLVILLLLMGGYAYRYKQTKVRFYGYLTIAILMLVIYTIGAVAGASGVALIIVGAIFVVIANVIIQVTVVLMLRAWNISMKDHLEEKKYDTTSKVVKFLLIVYPGFWIAALIFTIVAAYSAEAGGILLLLDFILLLIAVFVQLVLSVWLYLGMETKGNESLRKKKNQIGLVAILSVLGILPYLLSFAASGLVAAILYWIFYAITLWPGALVGYDDVPDTLAPAVMVQAPREANEAAYPPPPPVNPMELVQTGVDEYGKPIYQHIPLEAKVSSPPVPPIVYADFPTTALQNAPPPIDAVPLYAPPADFPPSMPVPPSVMMPDSQTLGATQFPPPSGAVAPGTYEPPPGPPPSLP